MTRQTRSQGPRRSSRPFGLGRTLAASALLAVVHASGCASVNPFAAPQTAAALPAFRYHAGTASQTFARSPDDLVPTLHEAMADLNMRSVATTTQPGAIELSGTTADGRRANVLIRSIAPNVSTTSARIGLFGDEALSKAMMDRLAIRLGDASPEAIPANPPSTPEPNPILSRFGTRDDETLRAQAEAGYRDAP